MTLKPLGDALAALIEVGVANGSGVSDEPIGLITVANAGLGSTATTYTDAAPTISKLITKLAACATGISTARKQRPQIVVMHSRRWFWMCSEADTVNTPIAGLSTVPPAADLPYVGTIAGLPVLISDGIPTNVGAGLNEDVIILCRPTDIDMQETLPTVEAMLEASATGYMRMWTGEYLAFTSARYPTGLGIASPLCREYRERHVRPEMRPIVNRRRRT